MSEEMRKAIEQMNMDEETKKWMEDMAKEHEENPWSGNWIWIVLMLFFLIGFPHDNSAMHYDKQTIAYQKGKIEAYEKVMGV